MPELETILRHPDATELDALAVATFLKHSTGCTNENGADSWSCDGCEWTYIDDSEYVPAYSPGLAHTLRCVVEAVNLSVSDGRGEEDTRIQAVRDLHRPVEIEPSDTICTECSLPLPNGQGFGETVDWPCATIRALGGDEEES